MPEPKQPITLVRRTLAVCTAFPVACLLEILFIQLYPHSPSTRGRILVIWPAILLWAVGFLFTRLSIRALRIGLRKQVWTSDQLAAARTYIESMPIRASAWIFYIAYAVALLISLLFPHHYILEGAFLLPPVWIVIGELRALLKPPALTQPTDWHEFAPPTSANWGEDAQH